VADPERRRATTCTYHCSACGAHFHALEGFDAHRQGDYASDDPEAGRRCVDPRDLDEKLSILTAEGECRVYERANDPGVGIKRNVAIWTSNRTKGTRPWETIATAA
jgi:hypothetical protein